MNKDSLIKNCKKLIEIRKKKAVIVYGDYELLTPSDVNVFAYERNLNGDKMVIVCNFYNQHVEFSYPSDYQKVKLMISNEQNPSMDFLKKQLRPYEATMYRIV